MWGWEEYDDTFDWIVQRMQIERKMSYEEAVDYVQKTFYSENENNTTENS